MSRYSKKVQTFRFYLVKNNSTKSSGTFQFPRWHQANSGIARLSLGLLLTNKRKTFQFFVRILRRKKRENRKDPFYPHSSGMIENYTCNLEIFMLLRFISTERQRSQIFYLLYIKISLYNYTKQQKSSKVKKPPNDMTEKR